MNILSEVLQNDVFPALGCTEPIAVAYAAGLAASLLDECVEKVQITTDSGVYKNGLAVSIPNAEGERGNLIAGALGALIRQPDRKMKILEGVTPALLNEARKLVATGEATIQCNKEKTTLYIDVQIWAGKEIARAIIQGSHTNVIKLERNGRDVILANEDSSETDKHGFRKALSNLSFDDLVNLVEQIKPEELYYIKQGVEMNLHACEKGKTLQRVGYYIAELLKQEQREAGVESSCEVMTASAADARMGGLGMPVMSSGGSGNQGIVSILVPYLVGKYHEVTEEKVLKSIALSHLINSYIKCFTGDLSPLCGCAISAGVGASVAIVYQREGKNLPKMTLATNNLISDLGGMLCDGAKEGCALKVASSTGSAIRAAHMALNNHGITQKEGFVGATAEETIRNLSRVGMIGMSRADSTMLDIMIAKSEPKDAG